MTISVIGISYSNGLLSAEARETLAGVDVAIGHANFVAQVRSILATGASAFDVLDDIRPGETFLTARVRHAIALNAAGKEVAILSSGDPGVFGMGGAVLNEVARSEGPEAAGQVRIIPGMSAYQVAASILGSPLNGGFATLALCIDSVPVDIIDRQICGTAISGLPCVVFMPRHNAETYPELHPGFPDPVEFSRQRVSFLIEEFRKNRKGTTPVVVASHLGRPDQVLRRYTLDSTMDAFDSLTPDSVVFLCAEGTIELGGRLVMPTW